MERIISMIGRHLIRIKVLQTVYAYKKNDAGFEYFYKQLETSFTKSYEQYLVILALLADLRLYAEKRITKIQDRQIKNEPEWKRLVRFSENRVLKQLEDNSDLLSEINARKLFLDTYEVAEKEIFNTCITSEFYDEYIASPDTYKSDLKFVKVLLNNVVAETELLFDSFEEQSIFCNDENDYIVSMVDKTIRSFDEKNPEGGALLPMFADAGTHDFGYTLFTKTVSLWDEINPYIDKNLKNWEQNRVADMDIYILQIAIAEMLVFPEIPIPVTMNEYIELAKWYSTQKSSSFINGILYKVADDLKREGKLKKVGRGLI